MKMLGGSAWRFTWSLSTVLLAAAAASRDIAASSQLTNHHADGVHGSSSGRLAVVVPTQQGDLSRAVGSLQRWPWTCSPETQRSVDLVVYYGQMADEADGDAAVTQATQTIAETAGLCFSTTRVVYAHLDAEVRREIGCIAVVASVYFRCGIVSCEQSEIFQLIGTMYDIYVIHIHTRPD